MGDNASAVVAREAAAAAAAAAQNRCEPPCHCEPLRPALALYSPWERLSHESLQARSTQSGLVPDYW